MTDKGIIGVGKAAAALVVGVVLGAFVLAVAIVFLGLIVVILI